MAVVVIVPAPIAAVAAMGRGTMTTMVTAVARHEDTMADRLLIFLLEARRRFLDGTVWFQIIIEG